jgi:hypothetical protein
MFNFSRLILPLVATCLVFLTSQPASAQVIGRCISPSYNASYSFLTDGMIFQEQNPANRGYSARDPSGQTFLRLPSQTPQLTAYFVGWNGSLIEVHYQYGMRQIGGCQFNINYIPPPPFANIWQPPVMAANFGIQTPQGVVPVPQTFADANNPFAAPRLVSENQAVGCLQQSSMGGNINRGQFADCMLRQMTTPQEMALINCAKAADQASIAVCMVGQLGGTTEQQAAAALANCHSRFGADYSRYPLCLAEGYVPPEAAKLLACVQQQGNSGDVSVIGTAVCYGAQNIRMNAETQIIISCAVATGGEPYSMAGCAGGQLTARELDKCFTHGIGGNGCFGRNNTIVQALGGTGQWLAGQFGPNNTLVQTWNNTVNDIRYGPGPNHEANRVIRNVGNELSRGTNNVRREVGKVLKGIRL